MKKADQFAKPSGFARVDLLVLFTVLTLLFLAWLPALRSSHHQAKRSQCVNNLQNFGAATKRWAADHHDRYPWQIPPINGGTLSNGAAWVHFNVLLNEVSTPKIFHCPSDLERHSAANFDPAKSNSVAVMQNGCLSYGIGTDAGTKGLIGPPLHLALDRNLTNTSTRQCSGAGFTVSRLGIKAAWTKALHNMQGNILLADGSVHQMSQSQLTHQLSHVHSDGEPPNCTLIP